MPRVYDLAGVPVKVLFAPDHTPELEIIKQMLKLRHEVARCEWTRRQEGRLMSVA